MLIIFLFDSSVMNLGEMLFRLASPITNFFSFSFPVVINKFERYFLSELLRLSRILLEVRLCNFVKVRNLLNDRDTILEKL